jgi:sugar/nucleoside kinase (ribokinase family)
VTIGDSVEGGRPGEFDRMLVDAQPRPRITSPPVSTNGDRARTLCLGEALVDLICERPIDDLAQADAFSPHFGGVVANVAVAAARRGAGVAIAGGAGDDDWGRWLLTRLRHEGVDVSRFVLIDGSQTPLAVTAVDAGGEPTYAVYGQPLPTVAAAVGDDVEDAVTEAAALFVSSNTLVGTEECAVTLRAVRAALAVGRPLVLDANIRLHRWRSPAEAGAVVAACVGGALLVRANEQEAALMTGEAEVERAAAALVHAGARTVVITLGRHGAILRGEVRADVRGVPARVVSTVGAGDVLTGTLLAGLAAGGFSAAAVAEALPSAVQAGARACERWAALE